MVAHDAEKASAPPGPGGNPMEMMQKMMAQMSQVGGTPPMMQMCMSMCSEMLNAIRESTAMAGFVTPELQRAFSVWLSGIEAKAQAVIAGGAKDATELAAALGIGEASARYVMGRLAADGKVTLTAQARS
jgi:hypothetical protein